MHGSTMERATEIQTSVIQIIIPNPHSGCFRLLVNDALCAVDKVLKLMVQVGSGLSWHFGCGESRGRQLRRRGLRLYCRLLRDTSFSPVSASDVLCHCTNILGMFVPFMLSWCFLEIRKGVQPVENCTPQFSKIFLVRLGVNGDPPKID